MDRTATTLTRTSVLLAAGALAHSAGAQIVSTPHGYVLQADYHAGQVLKFSATTGIKGVLPDGTTIGATYPVTLTVKKVVKGIASVKITFGPIKSGPHAFPLKLLPGSIRLDRHNTPINSSYSAPVALFPNHPVKIGDKWSGMSNFQVGAKNGGYAVETEYKLTGEKTERGKHIFVLTLALRGFAFGEGTILVDGADGSVLSEVLNLKVKTDQGTFPMAIINKRN